MKWRLLARSMFWLRAVLLLFALARFVGAHQEIRPVYASASVAAVVYNNLYHLWSAP